MNVADKIAEWLDEKEIRTIFGIIGSANMAIFDAISKKKSLTLVCCHHEAAAATASDFFNRTAGGLKSACLVTAGAGSSNALTGVLAAYMDSKPLLVISGAEASYFFDRPSPRVIGVQSHNAAQAAIPFVKLGWQPSTTFSMESMDTLYRIATVDRQGPVWASIPKDIQVAPCN